MSRLLPTLPVTQAAEWLPARTVLLCEPNAETLYALLETHAANFLRPFSLVQARAEHRAYRKTLEANGIEVIDLREALAWGCEEEGAALERLRCWTTRAITQNFDLELTAGDCREAQQNLQAMLAMQHPHTLADLILLRPTLHVSLNHDTLDPTTRLCVRFEVAPANNIYYMRDPLITTSAGCVIGRLKLAVRQPENDIADFALQQLGIKPVYRVQAPGHLEGGDFLPCGDFVLQGQGLLSDEAGVGQCLANGVYGFVEVGVVRDPRSQMDEMHLDTYFTVLDADLCALCENRAGDAEPLVDVYVPEGTPQNFAYRKTRTVGFRAYLAEKGMTVLPFTKGEQEAYAPNGLLVKPRHFLGVKGCGDAYAGQIAQAGVRVTWLNFDALTGGYGGPHCSSQVLCRG